MNALAHQIAQGLMDDTMSGDRVQSGETVGGDLQKKVPAAGRSRMPGVPRAVIADFQARGFENFKALT